MNNEKLYKKVGKRYVEVSLPEKFDMQDGVWLVQSEPYSKSFSSLMWLVGDLKRPADITTHAAMQSIQYDVARYLVKLIEKDSKEYNEAKEILGGYFCDNIGFYGISASDLAKLILRQIALHLEDGEKLHWDMLQLKFRDDIGLDKLQHMGTISGLYAFTEWLKKNEIKFRQGKNIG